MTAEDRTNPHPGYWPSFWPVECGGNRRQKAASGRLDAATRSARTITNRNDRWNVMVVLRDPGEWYVGGTMAAFTGPPPYGWVQKLDVETLQPLAQSPELPCGDHVWCGAVLAHANGSIMSVNGSYLHSLDPDDLSVERELKLPADRSHNGLLALGDTSLITKDLQLEGQDGTTITRVDADSFELIHSPVVLPEGSMGRIAADLTEDGEFVYVPGTEHIWRLLVTDDGLEIEDWRPRYRQQNDTFGLSWDSCLSAGAVWLMDCGDITSVRRIHRATPNGRFETPPGGDLSWRLPAPWDGAQRLIRIDVETGETASIEPFGSPGGGIIAPPVHVPELDIAIAWDSINGGLAGIDTAGPELEVAWHLDVRPSMQPVVYPESGELVINDFTDLGRDELVVVDMTTGSLLDRVDTGSRIANGMFLSPDGEGGVFYCTTTTLSHVRWE